jgi:hypothetical protein
VTPIFIGGCGRSGTTLLGAILGAHSLCVCTPESPFKFHLARGIETENLKNGIPLADAKHILRRNYDFAFWGVDLEKIKFSVHNAAAHIDFSEFLTEVVREYARVVGKSNANIWVDHTPRNVSKRSALLATWFPKAKFIHMVRDGRGVAASVMRLDWGPNTIVEAARYWLNLTSSGLNLEQALGSERVLRVKYEDLMQDPARTVRHICGWLGIDYEPGLEQRRGLVVPVMPHAEAQHVLVEKDIDPTRMSAWSTRLSTRQVEIFETLAGERLEHFGYPKRFMSGNAKPITARERLAMFLYGLRRTRINKWRLIWLKYRTVGRYYFT